MRAAGSTSKYSDTSCLRRILYHAFPALNQSSATRSHKSSARAIAIANARYGYQLRAKKKRKRGRRNANSAVLQQPGARCCLCRQISQCCLSGALNTMSIAELNIRVNGRQRWGCLAGAVGCVDLVPATKLTVRYGLS